jgi:Tol biopolymer transport system component
MQPAASRTANHQRETNSVRQLQSGQISELVVARRDGAGCEVVYRTHELIEAPNWTPDGRWLIFNAGGRLYRLSPDGAEGPVLIETGALNDLNNDHVVSPDGRWLFLSSDDGHLYRVSSEGGDVTRVSNQHGAPGDYRYYLHGISPDRETLAYVGLTVEQGRTVTRVCTIPAEGGPDRILTDGAHPVDGPEFSPDGAFLYLNAEAADRAPGHAQIYRMKLDGKGVEQLTFDDRVNWFPHISPDGATMAYLSYPSGTLGHPADHEVIIRLARPDGSDISDLDAFNGGQGSINVASWAPDSSKLAYVRYPFSASAA